MEESPSNQTCLEQGAAADDLQVPPNPHYSMISTKKQTKNPPGVSEAGTGNEKKIKWMHTGMLRINRNKP